MNILSKILFLSILSLFSVQCFAYETMYFQLRHVEARADFQTPAKGDVSLYINVAKQYDWEHQVTVKELLLGEMKQEHVKGRFLFSDVSGEYAIHVVCTGRGKFSGQETELDKFSYLNVRQGIGEVDISFACPTNGTTLAAPQLIDMIQKPR
jgi:hypothetical protein